MLIYPVLQAMTPLTVDLQDLGCHVGFGQRHMLHTAGVGNAVIPLVHLELKATPHCEWLSCSVHLLSACGESEYEPGWNVLVNYLYFWGSSSSFWARLLQENYFGERSRAKQKSSCKSEKLKKKKEIYFKMLLFWHRQLQCCCCCFSLHLLWGKESLAFESQVKVEWIVKGEQYESWLGWLGVFAPLGPSLRHPSQHKQAYSPLQ